MRDKRVKLFNQLIDLANKKGEFEQFENKYKDYNGWESFNFKNVQTVTDLYNKTIALKIISSNSKIEDFFKKFACDLDWSKKTTYCGRGAQQPTTPNPVFACLLNHDSGGKILKTDSPNQVKELLGDEIVFYLADYSLLWKDKTNTNVLNRGTWKCDGDRDFIIYTKDGDDDDTYWSSKTKKWTPNDPTTTPTSTTGGITLTTLTADDLKAGKFVKLGMKGDIIGKIQELLISKGYKNISKDGKVDKIFGNRTHNMVKAFQKANDLKDDGAVGKLTWSKLNDSSSSSSGEPNRTISVKSTDEVPGSDAVIMEQTRKKILRKYLLEFKK